MSTFGCHSCGVDLESLKGKPYESWPCATCALSKNYDKTFSTGFFDTGDMEEMIDPSADPREHEFVSADSLKLSVDDIQSLETIKKAISNQIYATFADTIVRMLYMAKKHPVMFEVVLKKLRFPYMSYSDIGASMSPECSKQNVLYHLKHAVSEFPELLSVLLTDTRYSSGHYALRTVATKKKRAAAEKEIQRTLYGPACDRYSDEEVDRINAILKLPFMMEDDVFTFNAYIQDEAHVAASSEDKG